MDILVTGVWILENLSVNRMQLPQLILFTNWAYGILKAEFKKPAKHNYLYAEIDNAKTVKNTTPQK